jgi:hypothetical protein
MGYFRLLSGAASLGFFPGSMLHILIKVSLSSWTTRSRMPPFPLQKNRCVLANCNFTTIAAALKVSGLQYLGRIELKAMLRLTEKCAL